MTKLKRSITSNPKVLVGKPVIQGTRISVEFVLSLLSSGWTYNQITKEYGIKEKDILAAIEFAGQTLRDVQSVTLSSGK